MLLKKSDSNVINDETFSSRDDDLLEALEMNPLLLSQFSYYYKIVGLAINQCGEEIAEYKRSFVLFFELRRDL